MTILKVCTLFFLTIAAYCVMLSSPFKTLDDHYSIVNNTTVKDTSQWPKLFTQGYFNDKSYYRPLVNLSFMAEHKLFGLNPFFYNFDNLLIHLANVFLVWAVVTVLVSAEVGFWSALLFAIHPVQWESVSNISGRAIILSTMFTLAAFLAYLKERHIAALLCFVMALLCKESAAVLPAILFVYARLSRKNVRWLLAWGVIITAYMFWRHHLGITQTFPWRNITEGILGFLTFLRSLITDLRILILPFDMHFDRSREIFYSIMDPQALGTMLFWFSVMVGLWVYRNRLNKIHWLCLVWFVLLMLPVSQLVTTIGVQPGFISSAEHFLYFSCVPVFVVIVSRLIHLHGKVYKFIIAGILGGLFLTTVEQNIYAQNELAMMERSLRIQPQNARLHSSVGLIYALAGKFVQAEQHFRAAVAADPLNARYLISLGKSICDQGRFKECLVVYDHIKDPGSFKDLLEGNREAALRLQRDNDFLH